MSLRRAVVCDECLTEAESPDGVILAQTAVQARREARNAGWLISRGSDLCPDCFVRVSDEDER